MNTTTHNCDLIPEVKAQSFGNWLPIETAPKDGTEVLLVNRSKNIASGMHLTFGWVLRGGNGPNPFFNNHYGPTHWMPLPQPPKDQQ